MTRVALGQGLKRLYWHRPKNSNRSWGSQTAEQQKCRSGGTKPKARNPTTPIGFQCTEMSCECALKTIEHLNGQYGQGRRVVCGYKVGIQYYWPCGKRFQKPSSRAIVNWELPTRRQLSKAKSSLASWRASTCALQPMSFLRIAILSWAVTGQDQSRTPICRTWLWFASYRASKGTYRPSWLRNFQQRRPPGAGHRRCCHTSPFAHVLSNTISEQLHAFNRVLFVFFFLVLLIGYASLLIALNRVVQSLTKSKVVYM